MSKKQRRHKNKKDNLNSLQSSQSSQPQPLSQPLSLSSNLLLANSSVVDDVLDAVAYSTTTNELNDADEIPVPATHHSEPSDQQAPSALGTMMSLCMKTHIVPISTAIAALQDEVRQLKDLIAKLTAQVCDMSVPLTNITGSESQHDNVGRLQAVACPHPTTSRAALSTTTKLRVGQPLSSNPNQTTADLRCSSQQEANNQQAVTAMYIDLKKKQQRSSNIVISGLPASDNDVKSVIELLRSEFECDIEDWPGADVIRCKRLGKQQNNKTQSLLATLGSRDQATYFIKNARYLRSSNIKAVREGVYINADLTPPEAKAAYELRLKRKQRQQREQNKGGQQSDQATTESTRRVRLVYRSTAATTTTILHPSDQPYPHDDLSSLTNDCGSRESTTTALNQVRLEASSSEASMEAKNDQMSNAEAQHISLQWR